MAFADDFAQALVNTGVSISASDIPSQDTIQAGLDNLQTWYSGLDSTTSSALDDVTASFPVKVGLCDPTVNVAPGLDKIMQAFDAMSASVSVSTVLMTCKDALKSAANAAAPIS